MNRDPAFLFYFQDFAWGTRRFTLEEKGLYIELMCEQADSKTGSISEKDMNIICKTYEIDMNKTVISKFKKDENGYYNEVLRDTIKKRRDYSESRRQNRLSKPDKKDNISKTYDNHMVNEIEDVIENETKTVNKDVNKPKSGTNEMFDYFCKNYEMFLGNKYIATFAKDKKIIKDLLKVISKEELMKIIVSYFESTDDFIIKSGYTIGVLKSTINKIRNKPKINTNESRVSVHNKAVIKDWIEEKELQGED